MKSKKSSTKTYIILIIILLFAIISIVYLLNIIKDTNKKASSKATTTTTETLKTEVLNVSPFATPLSDIIGANQFLHNYKEEILYNGVIFNFNCTSYNEETATCAEGSGLMNIDSTLIPLFTYKNAEENYLKHADDYFLIVNDNYIILVSNEAGVKSGIAKVYGRDGHFKYDISNVITGYKENDKLYKGLYPNINNNIITYYACEAKKVKVLSLDLINHEEINYIEDIDKVSCE